MKINYLAILLMAVIFSSCNGLLEENPKGLLIGNVAIQDIDGLNAQLTGMYSSLQNGWEQGFASCAQIAMSMGADDVTTHPGLNKADIREFDQFNVNAYNSRMHEVWAGLYKSIQSANNIIVNYEKVPGNRDQINAIAGEAYFFRGMCYYYLVRWWGKVPIVKTPVYNTSMLAIQPSEPAEIYEMIESDLKQAEEWVGDTKPAPGRINKGTVKAYLADVYLTQAGWPVKNASKAALAAAKAKEVIDNKARYGFDLHPDFYAMFAGETSEDVFALMFNRSTKANVFYGSSAMPGDIGGWDDFFAEVRFFKDFPEGSRKDATFLTSVEKDGKTITWENFAVKHPYYRKFTIQRGKVNSYSSSMPAIMMRYANVLLVYAEAQARSTEPDASAYNAINLVRKRAGLSDLQPGLSKDAFIDAVIAERGWEFAGEWSRWFDLIRTETLEKALQNRDTSSEIALIGNAGDRKNWWMPIPGNDKDKNPNL